MLILYTKTLKNIIQKFSKNIAGKTIQCPKTKIVFVWSEATDDKINTNQVFEYIHRLEQDIVRSFLENIIECFCVVSILHYALCIAITRTLIRHFSPNTCLSTAR